MELIDTHCHLSALTEAELNSVLSNAAKCSVTKMLAIGASDGFASSFATVELSERVDCIWASVGIHPHDAGDFTNTSTIESLITRRKVKAIGETGLDFYRDWAPKENQIALFRSTIALAISADLPLVIHCRDAQDDVLRILKEESAEQVGGVFHCYAGDEKLAAELRKINFLVSFTGNITFKKAADMREVVKAIPLEQIMLETDSPYMAPEPHRGKPSEPMHVYAIAEKLPR